MLTPQPTPADEAARAAIFAEIERWFAVLNAEFGIAPIMEFPRGGRGRYRRSTKTFTVPRGSRHPLRTFMHEYAHALNDARRTGEGHDPAFYACLREVARRVLGDEARYAWDDEYRRIAKWAYRDGLLKTKPLTNRERYVRLYGGTAVTPAAVPAYEVSDFGIVRTSTPWRGDADHAVVISPATSGYRLPPGYERGRK